MICRSDGIWSGATPAEAAVRMEIAVGLAVVRVGADVDGPEAGPARRRGRAAGRMIPVGEARGPWGSGARQRLPGAVTHISNLYSFREIPMRRGGASWPNRDWKTEATLRDQERAMRCRFAQEKKYRDGGKNGHGT